MSILSKYNEAFLNKDEAAMNEILHDDYKFTMHASGNVLSKQDNVPILVFDEIDANIGGEIANAVGEKLKKISEKHQVICITHLPQVASQESNHIHVSKSVIDGRTFSTMNVLNKDNRPLEIARMLSGDETSEISIKHAKSLLNEN